MTEQPPIQPTPVGAFRFNTDSAKLEYFDGNEYVNITTDSPEQNTGGTRGLTAGSYPAGNQIDFFNIDTTGNATDFGDMTVAARGLHEGSATTSTRGLLISGKYDSGYYNVINFVTFSTAGNATDFGDTTGLISYGGAISDTNGGLAQ